MMEALGHALSAAAPALLELFVRSALLLALAAVAAQLLRGASAALRHLVWASALWALLVLPVASLFAPGIVLPILPTRASPDAPETPPVAAAMAAELAPQPVPPDDAVLVASSRATVGHRGAAGFPEAGQSMVGSPSEIDTAMVTVWTWPGIAVGVWALVALALLAEMGRSRLRLRRLAAGAWRIHDPAWWRAAARIGRALGLQRPVLLLATGRVSVPLTWGTRAPIVLLPAGADRWPAERREAVLVHELAHVARGDARGHNIARIAVALFWANPLVWVALRMMRAERERACDDLVLATGTRASTYASDLLQIAMTVGGRSHGAAAAALAMARPSELEGRLLAILDPGVPRRPASRAARLAAGVVAVLMLIPLAALRPAEREPAVSPVAETNEPPDGTAEPPLSQPVALPPRTSTTGIVRASAPDVARNSEPNAGAPILASADVRAIEGDPLEPANDFISGPSIVADTTLPAIRASGPTAPTRTAPVITSAARDPDLETLVAVARAAGKLSSDHEKAELLLTVLAQGVHDETLHSVVLQSASTIESSFHRHRVMVAMLRNPLPPGTETQFLGAVGGISGAHERSTVLTAFANANRLDDAVIRQSYLQAAVRVSSQHNRTQLLALLIRKPEFDAAAAIDVLKALDGVTASHERANLLVAIAQRGVTDDPEVRDAFIIRAASLSSASDYKRVIRAAGLLERSPDSSSRQ